MSEKRKKANKIAHAKALRHDSFQNQKLKRRPLGFVFVKEIS